MSNDPQTALVEASHFSPAQLDVLKRTVCKDATEHELAFFAQVCRAKKLDPFGQQIFLVKRKDRDGGSQLAIQTGIDGFRATAAKSGEYAGNDEPVFHYDSSGKKEPVSASVTVWRMIQGQRVPFTATARWDEFYPGEKMGFMWRSKPHVMLGKCAEAQALRKAFPNECGGLYETAEMDADAGITPQAAKASAVLNARLPGAKAPQKPVDGLPPAEQVRKMVAAFESLGVTPEQVAAKIGKTVDQMPNLADMETLRGWYEELVSEKEQAESKGGEA